jgi:hypothetical protein
VFISHATEDRHRYDIEELVEELKKHTEREREGAIREVYITGEEKIPESQLILFIATRTSLQDSACRRDLGLALTYTKKIIPIKGEDIEWEDLKHIDLGEEGQGDLNLGAEKGFIFDSKHIKTFYNELLDYIKLYKRTFNLFEASEEALDDLKRTSENIIVRFLMSEKFREILKGQQIIFEELCRDLSTKKISVPEFFLQCDQLLTRTED